MKVNDLILFAYESGICMAVLFSLYLVFLRNETYYRFNRIYLLGTVLISCLLPIGNFSLSLMNSKSTALYAISTIGEAVRIPEVIVTYGSTGNPGIVNNWQQLLILAYLVGVIILLTRMILGITGIIGLNKSGRRINHEAYSIIYIKRRFAPFSFFRTIFINEDMSDKPEKWKIIDHEIQHVKQLHTCDNILIEIFLTIFWFNPFIWLIKKALRNTHEYLADSGVINAGTSRMDYQSILLKQIPGLAPLIVTNNFNDMIKNRIKMMSKSKPTVLAKLKPLLLTPVLTCLTLVFACTDSEKEMQSVNPAPEQAEKEVLTDNSTPELAETIKSVSPEKASNREVFLIVEEMPSFQENGPEGFREYIANNLRYPESAASKGINGRVYVQFTVSSEGQVSNVVVVRGVDPDLDVEAVRVVESSPPWIPGKQKGQNVAVQFTFPVNFVLK